MSVVGGAVTAGDISAQLIPDVVSECALGVDGAVCSSDRAVAHMSEMVHDLSKSAGAVPKTPEVIPDEVKVEVVEAAKQLLNCDSERCVLSNPVFEQYAGKQLAEAEIDTNLKVLGPTSTALLNNYNIDNTLQQWAVKFNDPQNKFFAYNFNMLDFKAVGDSLHTVKLRDLYSDGYRTFGCVINTDHYKGPGKHWMALFGDMRANSNGSKWTVEFFNSSGNLPQMEYAEWLTSAKSQMIEIAKSHNINVDVEVIKCCDKEHQKSSTECGVYSLYYIYSRLNGIPAEFFKSNLITDELCFEFRQHLFFDPGRDSLVGKSFDFKEFSKSTKVKWAGNNREVEGGDDVDSATEPNNNQTAKNKLSTLTDAELAETKIDVVFDLFLGESSRELPYRADAINKLSLLCEPRGNLLTEISFLCLYGHLGKTVVHTEQHPRTHQYLTKLFPKHKFVKYNGANPKNALLLSNLNMTAGIECIRKIQPVASLLKFQLSATETKTKYLHGKVMIQPWSNSTKLVVVSHHDLSPHQYDNVKYANQMHRHNMITRSWQWFDHSVSGDGLDHCWDCAAEIQILRTYIKLTKSKLSIARMSAEISAIISPNSTLVQVPHGIYKSKPMSEKITLLETMIV